jgi:hypothetical protein
MLKSEPYVKNGSVQLRAQVVTAAAPIASSILMNLIIFH